MNANEVRAQYIEQGYDCIPLRPNSKAALSKNWNKRTPSYQWRNAPDNSNFGLRAGNGRAFIDCDNKNNSETFTNVSNWLAGLGHKPGSYPVVQTASGSGRHVYVNFTGQLLGSAKNITPSMGAGEFRYSNGAYVAAPPSVVDTGTYRLLEGDISQLPTLDARDVEALVKVIEGERPAPRMSGRAYALAMGEGIERYQSRSHAEAALVLSLVNSRFEDYQIKRIFDTFPCAGHYKDPEKCRTEAAREHYLKLTIQNARDYAANESSTRRAIREVQELAERAAWGRVVTDKLVFMAHTEIAYETGKLEYSASSRDIALKAGVSLDTAAKRTRRLVGNNLLALTASWVASHPNRYAFDVDKVVHSLTPLCEGVSEVVHPAQVLQAGRVLDLEGLETSDAFRNGKGRLGRRAGDVYRLLFTESLTEAEIAKRTGVCVKTIRRTLAKLAAVKDRKMGEILEMVSCEGGRWHSNVVDLEIIEAIYGTRGARAKQRDEYERERREHARALERGSLRLAGG